MFYSRSKRHSIAPIVHMALEMLRTAHNINKHLPIKSISAGTNLNNRSKISSILLFTLRTSKNSQRLSQPCKITFSLHWPIEKPCEEINKMPK